MRYPLARLKSPRKFKEVSISYQKCGTYEYHISVDAFLSETHHHWQKALKEAWSTVT